jgi:hypothetical protein
MNPPATLPKWQEGGAFFALTIALGYLGPWWLIIAPGFVYGYWRSRRPGLLHTVAIASSCGWIVPAFIQDASVGFRISMRIGGVANLASLSPTFATSPNFAHLVSRLLAYAITGLIAALLATLAATVGSSLCAAVRRYAAARSSAASKPAGSPAV